MKNNPEKPAAHLVTGKSGEDLAVAFLETKGWTIAERNWRGGRGELDIIAWAEDQLLVFVEVKTRSSEAYGGPEGAINARKLQLMVRTAGLYMETIGYEWAVRFDVVAVILRRGVVLEVRHAEDIFFPR